MRPGPRALLDGKKFVEQGQYAEAIERLKQATALMTTNAQAWNYLGIACHLDGQLTNAAQAYERALALDHDLIEAHYNLGSLWLEQGRLDQAHSELTTYTSIRRSSPEGWTKLGAIQLREAEQERRSTKSGAAAARSQDLAAAERSFAEAARYGAENAELLNDLGVIQLLAHHHVQEAVRDFNEALKRQPNYPPAVLNLAVASQAYLNDPASALERYRQYLSLPGTGADRDAVTAEIHALELALKTASPATATSASTTPAGGTPTSTGSAGDGAEKTNPPGFFARLLHSDAKPAAASSGSNGVASTQKSEGRYVYRSPKKPAAGDRAAAERAFAQGLRAQEANQFSNAVQSYQDAVKLDPAYYEANYNLGLAAAKASRLPLSLVAYESALAIRPDSLDARYNFALILKQAGYPQDAANELERILSINPKEVRAHLALGNLYAQQLQLPAKAREQYASVLALDPNNPQSAAIRNWMEMNPR